MVEDFVPNYRKVRNLSDVDWNQGQMVMAFNHGMTKMAMAMIQMSTDVKWIKRFVFGISTVIGLLIVAALVSP